MREGHLGLGSNVGDRRANLQAATDALPAHGVEVLAASSVYETEPVGEVRDQPDFYNACLRVRTALDPEALLDACKAVERELGRVADGVRHGPRPIDVDLLLLGNERLRSARLSLPHEQVASRRFVLVPLVELSPELVIPGAGPAVDALAALRDPAAVRRVGEPLAVGRRQLRHAVNSC
jgi:2-amino-4-hydroxy-6-hydroxymethyldihydropteridine diphosphokinase